MFRRILVPADGTRGSEHAVRAASDLAGSIGAEVIAVHVVPPAVPDVAFMGLGVVGAPVPLDPAADPVPPEEDRALLQAASIAREAGVDVAAIQVRSPQPASAILDVAEEQGCDLIVMATDGYGSLLSALTGSLAAQVVRGGGLPVLVVH